MYLKPDATPTEARHASYVALETAATQLRELAADLDRIVASDKVHLAEYGDVYASHDSTKASTVQHVTSAVRDIARIQVSLIGAVEMAARA